MPYPLILLLGLIAVGSIAPSASLESWPELVTELRAAASLELHPPILITLLERFVTFVPAGALIHRELVRRQLARAPLAAAAAVAAFALAIELLQLPVAGRHARLSDLIVALAWGACGILISRWLGDPPARAKVRLVLVMLLALGNAAVTSVILRGHYDAELAGWDCSYPLLVGNELTGDRPWQGRIRGLAIYPRALSAVEILRLRQLPFAHAGMAARVALGSPAVFDLSRVPALTGTPALELDMPRTVCPAAMSARAVAIEAVVASAASDQSGPARIVSQSIDTMQRDFTLGQEGAALVFRVRTPWNGPNGSYRSLTAWSALADQGWHHVVAIYAGGAASLFLDGEQVVPTLRYYELMWLGETDVVPLAACAGLAFVAMGLVATWLFAGARWPVRLATIYLGAALIPTAAGLLLGLALGHDPDGSLVAAALLGPAIGAISWQSWCWLALRWRR